MHAGRNAGEAGATRRWLRAWLPWAPAASNQPLGYPEAPAEQAAGLGDLVDDLLVVLLWDALNGHARACGLPDSGTDGPIHAATDMLEWREAVNWPGLFDAEGRSVVAALMAEDAAGT